MSRTRRLDAILAADVAGYSRPMAADEGGMLERLKSHAPRADFGLAVRGPNLTMKLNEL
jgi:hypothetical protein